MADAGFVGQVAEEGLGLDALGLEIADGLDGFIFRPAIGDGDGCAMPGEGYGDGTADAPGGSSDEGGTTGEEFGGH